ncbi:hypothetical protein BH11PAT4_BH11PAT4_6430 [soil metagenome]
MHIFPTLPPVQREILRRLATASSLRYSELQLDDVEGNLHTYHLKELQAADYITKVSGGYALSVSGRRLVGIMSTSTGHPRLQPKLTTMLAIQNGEGKFALFRWNRHPFLGKVSLPYGKMHMGESVFAAAIREMGEKTGAADIPLTYRGTVFIRSLESGILLNHMETHVFSGVFEGDVAGETDLGECFWGVLEDVPEAEWCPGFPEVMDLLAAGKPFFEEIETVVD